jgi:hypothetical protein
VVTTIHIPLGVQIEFFSAVLSCGYTVGFSVFLRPKTSLAGKFQRWVSHSLVLPFEFWYSSNPSDTVLTTWVPDKDNQCVVELEVFLQLPDDFAEA